MIPLEQIQLISSGRLPQTVPGSIHPARCGAGFCPFPPKPACTCQNRHAPKASLKFSCRSCRALLFPPSKPYQPPLCTSPLAAREPGAPPPPAGRFSLQEEKNPPGCWLSPFHSLVRGFRAVNDTGFRLGI